MIVGVDASNLLNGGGVTHLAAFVDDLCGHSRYDKVYIWASHNTLSRLPKRKPQNVIYVSPSMLNMGYIQRLIWVCFFLSKEARRVGVDVLFVPGSLYLGSFKPFVTMHRNSLPFDKRQRKEFGFGLMRAKLFLLYFFQSITFLRADGIIFLSKFAYDDITSTHKIKPRNYSIVPHGVSDVFRGACDHPVDLVRDRDSVVEVIYVSTFYPYKHQKELVKAVSILSQSGVMLRINFVGGGSRTYQDQVERLAENEGIVQQVVFHGSLNLDEMISLYRKCDVAVYASACENFPNIVVEMMAVGIPIVSSGLGPMKEVLEDAAMYFDPRDPESIASAIKGFVAQDDMHRDCLVEKALKKSEKYSWEKTFSKTHQFISEVFQGFSGRR